MTDPACKIDDIMFLRFELKNLEAQKEYLSHFGMALAHETENAIYFRGTGTQPYSYVAQRGDSNRYIGAAFTVGSEDQLNTLAASVGAEVMDSDEPAGGRCVKCADLDGFGVEVYFGTAPSQAEVTDAPKLNAGFQKTRVNELQRFGRGPDEWTVKDGEWHYELKSRVMRLGHVAFNVADADASIEWYQKHLGVLISDNLRDPAGVRVGAFLRADCGDTPVDHHTLNIVAKAGPEAQFAGTFGHGGYEVTESVDDLMAGHYHLKTLGTYRHEWGIGRHLLGSQMYDYWRDPTGFTLEHWTDGDLLDASVPTNDSHPKEFIMAQYGEEIPTTFGLSMPNDQVDAFRESAPKITDLLKMLE
ncbi:MAG: VOC family protein [Pseudomonadales bacterium]